MEDLDDFCINNISIFGSDALQMFLKIILVNNSYEEFWKESVNMNMVDYNKAKLDNLSVLLLK